MLSENRVLRSCKTEEKTSRGEQRDRELPEPGELYALDRTALVHTLVQDKNSKLRLAADKDRKIQELESAIWICVASALEAAYVVTIDGCGWRLGVVDRPMEKL